MSSRANKAAATRPRGQEGLPVQIPPKPDGSTVRKPTAGKGKLIVVSAMALFFAVYYFWTASPCFEWKIDCSPNQIVEPGTNRAEGLYNLLAASFLSGSLSLPIDPDPRLLALADPYDPVQNYPYRLHDSSLYKGKFYLPFGPAPAIVLFAPFRFLTDGVLPDAVGCAALALGAYLISCLVLKTMLRIFFPELPVWVIIFLCFSLGFCNTYPYLLRRPALYEIAIAGGQLFLAAATLLIVRALLGASRHPFREAAFGGTMAGLAFASRPPLLLAAMVLFLMILLSPPAFEKGRTKLLGYVLAPFLTACMLVAWYNYARFDSPFEFGYKYQLPGYNARVVQLSDLGRMPIDLYLDLFCPPLLKRTFPFFTAKAHVPFSIPPNLLVWEPITGIVWLSPVVFSLLLIPWSRKGVPPEQTIPNPRPAAWALAFLVAAVAVLCVDGSRATTMRYQADVSNLFYLAGSLGFAGGLVALPAFVRSYVRAALIVMVSFGVILNAGLGMTGYYDLFRRYQPDQYLAIESVFEPVSKLLQVLRLESPVSMLLHH